MPTPNTTADSTENSIGQRPENVTQDVEGILQRLGNSADEQSEMLKTKARSALTTLRELERSTEARIQAAGEQTQRFVHEKPWVAIAVAAATAYALGALFRRRG